MSIHDEAKAQFIEGYGLFREHAALWLPEPSVTVCPDSAEYEALAGHLIPYAVSQFGAMGSSIITDSKVEYRGGMPVVTATVYWDGNPRHVAEGEFYDPGATTAYKCARGMRGLTGTTNATTFSGNWASGSKNKKIPGIVVNIDGKPYELTTTRSFDGLVDRVVAQIASGFPAGRAEQILDLSRLRPYYHLLQAAAPHLKANDLLQQMLGEYNPSSIDGFLKFLVEGPYESELDIHQLFRKFSGNV